jgi:hypothetical protein
MPACAFSLGFNFRLQTGFAALDAPFATQCGKRLIKARI